MRIYFLVIFSIFTLQSCKKNEINPVIKDFIISNDKHLSEKDMEFANFTAMDNIFTIKICENAIMNSKDQRVKALANLLIVIIKEFDKDLKNWSNENEITLTKEISIEQQKIENELFANKGVNFDYAFVDFLVINSKNRIEKYKEERSNGENSFFKSYTIKNIPILESNFIFYEEGATILK